LALMVSGTPSAQEIDIEQEQLARWHINYASYLIDVGKYLEALENYHTAIEVTALRKTKTDAMLAKATLLSSFLDADEEALKVYQEVGRNFPEGAEIAIYREGLLLFELNRFEEAAEAFKSYNARYPAGRFQFQAEVLMEKVKDALAKAPPSQIAMVPVPEPAAKPIPQPEPAAEPGPGQKPAVVKTTPAPEPSKPVVTPPTPAPTPAVKPVSGQKVPIPELRVRISRGASELILSGKDICYGQSGCRDSFTVTPGNDRVRINGRQTEKGTVIFRSEKPISISCDGKKKKLRGRISASMREGKLLVINLVEMEEYLLSVVPSESYASWPLDTLKAQAVAARTYAYYQKLHRENLSYDLVDDEGDQAYKGMERETTRSTKAVMESSGEVLMEQQRPILAMFSANSGGYTADAKAVFNLNKSYLTARPDPESLKGKMATWKKEFSTKDIEAALARIGIKARGISRIEAAEKGPSGRIVKVRIRSRDGDKVFRTRTTLGRALKLPEILVDIRRNGDRYEFDGRGWGHGVGYSQWGSAIMGKDTSYREILAFYYPGVALEKRW